MAAKLSDHEFVEHHRAVNRKRATRQRERLTANGMVSVSIWMPVAVKQRLAAAAASKGTTMTALTVELIDAGLN